MLSRWVDGVPVPKSEATEAIPRFQKGGLKDQIEAHSDYLECFCFFPFFVFFVDKIIYRQSNLAVPELDNTDTSLSRMKCCGFKKISQQNLTCFPGSLVVLNRFFGFWFFRDSEVRLYTGMDDALCVDIGISAVVSWSNRANNTFIHTALFAVIKFLYPRTKEQGPQLAFLRSCCSSL